MQSITIVVLIILLGVSMVMGMAKRPQLLGITESGRVVPLVPLDKPYVSDSRVLGFADECTRQAFSHDFVNFRLTQAEAGQCFTASGAESFARAMAPLLEDLEQRRMVMSITPIAPPTVVRTFKRGGEVYSWAVQSVITLNREGTRERMTPTSYVVDLVIERVPLEESVRGISVAQINMRPGGAKS
ncbi:DotI/IcmL family type IV secretion protein [Ramlibacter sp. AN1133]|uniref:DotI/IcmL family type IV secretion protein n=1 Tax=Ramlibacter sp. AN1133 TaxID=3133429 RepID=UPI0030C48F2D